MLLRKMFLQNYHKTSITENTFRFLLWKLNKNYKPVKAPQSYFHNEGSKNVENFYR